MPTPTPIYIPPKNTTKMQIMRLQSLRSLVLFVLFPLSLISLIYLYLYPVWHGCGFPVPPSASYSRATTTISLDEDLQESSTERDSVLLPRFRYFASRFTVVNTLFQHLEQRTEDNEREKRVDEEVIPLQIRAPAVFRLLVLADPQIEGDSSLPDPDDEFWPRVKRRWRYFFGRAVSNGATSNDNGTDAGMIEDAIRERGAYGERVNVDIAAEKSATASTSSLSTSLFGEKRTDDVNSDSVMENGSSSVVNHGTSNNRENHSSTTENIEFSNADAIGAYQINENITNITELNSTSENELREHYESALKLLLQRIRLPKPLSIFLGLFFDDIPSTLRAIRKRVDLFGNDFYLAHIYRTLHWWSRPTHVTVLGDLIGSQWVTDGEFDSRGRRFWDRVFRGGKRINDTLTVTGKRFKTPEENAAIAVESLEVLKRYDSSWENVIMNVAGNHDVGYAGDVSEARLTRFERVFGRANWDIRFKHAVPEEYKGITPTLHVINLNDLTLDTPALDESIQSFGYDFINSLITHRSHPVEDRTSFTLLLTHVPLHKKDGVCTDPPHFGFFDDYYEMHLKDNKTLSANQTENEYLRYLSGGLREQNHLSDHVSSTGVLQGIFGMTGNPHSAYDGKGRSGLVLTGHDHTGCDVIHFVNRTVEIEEDEAADPSSESVDNDDPKPAKDEKEWVWDAVRLSRQESRSRSSKLIIPSVPVEEPQIREITLRSMMGEYGGNAGLLSMWFDFETETWDYEIMMCPLGVQHIWWAVHVICLITVVAALIWIGVEAWYAAVGVDAVEALSSWIASKVRSLQYQDKGQVHRLVAPGEKKNGKAKGDEPKSAK